MRFVRSKVFLGVAAGAILLLAVVLAMGALFKDPSAGLFEVSLVNDTSQMVIIQTPCSLEVPKCFYKTYRTLEPGESASVATSDGNVEQHYRVVSQAGNVIGCLPLKFAKVELGTRVKVSNAITTCS